MDPKSPPHLLHVFSTFGTGGAQVRACDILNRFGRDFKHTILAMDGNLSARARLGSNLDVTFPDRTFRKKDTLRNPFRFRAMLREFKPDLLVTYNWGTIEWAMANCALPICGHVHMEDGFGPDEAHGQKPVRVWFRRIFLSRASVLLVPSLSLKRLALEVWKLPRAQVRYVPNGVDMAHYAAVVAEVRRSVAQPGGKSASRSTGSAGLGDHSAARFVEDGSPDSPRAPRRIGTVATLRKEKNIPRMLEAFRLLPAGSALLRIAGAGPELEPLKQSARGLAGAEFLGYQADPAPVMAGLDVFCISSDTEQMPLSVLEAMAAGLPVAGTDVGDIRNMVAEENHPFIVPAGRGAEADAAALSEALRRLCEDPALARAVGEANLRKCKRDYDKEAMYANHREIYLGCMKRR